MKLVPSGDHFKIPQDFSKSKENFDKGRSSTRRVSVLGDADKYGLESHKPEALSQINSHHSSNFVRKQIDDVQGGKKSRKGRMVEYP